MSRYLKITAVKVLMSAEDWELYTVEDADRAASEAAAKDLNSRFESMIRSGFTREEVAHNMGNLMEQYAHLGARDSEPQWKLNQLLKEAFPDNDD